MTTSVFLANNCKFEYESFPNRISWSSNDALAAIPTYAIDDNDRDVYQVTFTNNEGVFLSNLTITNDCEAMAVDWQPGGKLLAIGWADGMVSCWIVDGRTRPTSTFSNSSQHNAMITLVKWNPVGKRLITGDKRGLVCVWSVDARGALTPTRQYKKKGAITSAVYCTVPTRSDAIRRSELKNTYSPPFFFGTDQGAVVYADDLGHSSDVNQLQSSIDIMMFFEEKSRLVIITRTLMLSQFQVAEDGKITRIQQVKLSVAGDVVDRGLRSVVWCAPGILAIATHEKLVRLLDLATDESYNLSLTELGALLEKGDRVISAAFSSTDRYLAVGTQLGFIIIWKYNGPIRDIAGSKGSNVPIPSTSPDDWELFYKTQCQGAILQLSWFRGSGILGAVTEESVVVLTELVMKRSMCGDFVVVQTGNEEIQVTIAGSQNVSTYQTGMLIRGVHSSSSSFVIWNGEHAKVYRLVDPTSLRLEQLELFPTPSPAIVIADVGQISEDTLFLADQNMIRVANYGGTQRSSITFSEAEGSPQWIDLNGKYLAAVTDKGAIGVFDVYAPKKPKALGTMGKFYDSTKSDDNSKIVSSSSTTVTSVSSVSSSLSIKAMKVNCEGTRVALIADQMEGSLQIRHPDCNLYVYDRNRGSILTFDFTPYSRCPIGLFWDSSDGRMLAVEALRNRVTESNTRSNNNNNNNSNSNINNNNNNSSSKSNDNNVEKSNESSKSKASESANEYEVEVFMFFVSSEHGIIMQDSFHRRQPFGNMLNLSVPRLFFQNSPAQRKDDAGNVLDDPNVEGRIRIYSKIMRDFVGMEDVDAETKSGLLDFSFHLTLGKLDEAYRAVKTIGSPALWENMAQMCVKTKRLDVAEVCLGNMGHARGAAALRKAKQEGNIDAIVGTLAIHLGLLDEAVRLYKESGRFDLMNKLYQAAGLWEKAIVIAEEKDRLHMKTTHFEYARHLESLGNVEGAIQHYEISDTHRAEVPRMLYHRDRVEDLEDYVHRSEDKKLLVWWAAYLESSGRYDGARKYYNKGGDYLSLVRILCFKGDFRKAADIIQEVGDRSAAYHFARQMENQGNYEEAINFYALSGCYNHCIRLAKAYGLDSELMRFALKSTPSLMIESANHFEQKGEFDKAVQLYHKGGDLPRALDLCFRAGEIDPNQSATMFDMLNTIAQDLGADTSPQTLARCAEFLVNHKQYGRAIDLYIMAKRYHQAIEMCSQHKIPINDELVDRLTPPESFESGERKEVLKELAKTLKKQGLFTLASKKYTQAGDRVHAIKCLVRSGDTKAVIQFATISRNAEIYTLAANYLQQMNWRESVDIMKAIIMFYTKAKSFEQLAGFYDSCAQVEMDEYRDYDKAIAALREALKYASKAESRSGMDLAHSIEKRIGLTEKFVQARRVAKSDPDSMVAICETLLQDPIIEEAIRSGDCYAMLVEYFHSRGMYKEAYQYLQEMEDKKIPLHPYVDAAIIDKVFKAVGASYASSSKKISMNNGRNGASESKKRDEDDDDVEEAEEEIDEEVEEEEEDPRRRSYGKK